MNRRLIAKFGVKAYNIDRMKRNERRFTVKTFMTILRSYELLSSLSLSEEGLISYAYAETSERRKT